MPGGYTPAGIPGIAFWLEADQIVGVADGAGVALWPDASGVGNDAIGNGGGSAQPLWSAAGGPLGRPAVVFNGSTTYLIMPAGDSSFANGLTLFGVINPATVASNGAILGGAPPGGAAQGYLEWRVSSPGKIDMLRTNLSTIGSTPTAAILAGSWTLVSSDFLNPGLMHHWYNGVQVASNTNPTPLVGTNRQQGGWFGSRRNPNRSYPHGPPTLQPTVSYVPFPMVVGAQRPTTEVFSGSISLLIGFNRVLTNAERVTVHAYIQDKYGIQASDYPGPYQNRWLKPLSLGPRAVGPLFFRQVAELPPQPLAQLGASGSQDATSDAPGTASVPAYISGTDFGASSAPGTATVIAQAVGTAGAAAVATGQPQVAAVMSGSNSGVGTAAGGPLVTGRMSGSDSGASAAAGSATVPILVVESAGGVGTASGQLVVPANAAGSDAGTGTATGQLKVVGAIGGSEGGTGGAGGAPATNPQIVGTQAGVGAGSGNGVVPVSASGSFSAVGTELGALLAAGRLSGASAATGTESGNSSATARAAGNTVGSGGTAGTATSTSRASGSQGATSASGGAVGVVAVLTGIDSGASGAGGQLLVSAEMVGAAGGASDSTGAAEVRAVLVGSGDGVGGEDAVGMVAVLTSVSVDAVGGATGVAVILSSKDLTLVVDVRIGGLSLELKSGLAQLTIRTAGLSLEVGP